MSNIDKATTLYILFMMAATFVSFKYGSTMIRKTGSFLPQALIAGTINLVLGVVAIIVWFIFAWGVNEFLFFGGVVLGVCLLVVGEAVLFTILFLKRKKWA